MAVDLCKAIERPSDEFVKRTVVGSIDLDDEFIMNSQYLMRGHTIVIMPGGKTKFRSHRDKPSVTYVVSGSPTEHRSDQPSPLLRKLGDSSVAIDNVATWWENTSKETVMLFEVDFTELSK